jgi:hypothetical protein
LEPRHIAVACDGDHVALGAFEEAVVVWSLVQHRLLSKMKTVLDFGGQRLAVCLNPDPVVVAGAWERHGICGYSLDGTLLWQRKDLKKVQALVSARRGAAVAACFTDGPMRVLDTTSGETISEVRAVRGYAEGSPAGLGAAALRGGVALLDTEDWNFRWKASVPGFALLDIALATGALAASGVAQPHDEDRSGISCFDLSGEQIWRWQAPSEVNVPRLGWDGRQTEWVGVLNHVNNREPDTLARWSVDGEIVARHPLGSLASYELTPDAALLVTDQGVFDARQGDLLWGFGT